MILTNLIIIRFNASYLITVYRGFMSQNIKTSEFVSELTFKIPPNGINFKEFLELIEDRGILLACLFLVAPFLLPVSIPGSSLPFGLAIALLNMSYLLGGRSLLPDAIMDYKISKEVMIRILNGMQRILSGLERISKPRFMFMTNTPVIKYLNNIIIIYSASLLMLPLPVPLTDFLPGYCILFLALGSLERDGYLILAGYVLVAVTTLYFALIVLLGIGIIKVILSQFGFSI